MLGWMETDKDGLVTWSWEPVQGSQKVQVLELAAQGKSYREIAGLTGLPKSTVERWIKKSQP